MVLKHVPNRSNFFVKLTALSYTKRLGHRDLHARDVLPIPDRLEKRVGESKEEQVPHRLLAEEVIDPKNGGFVEEPVEGLIERARRGEIAPERFLDDDPCALGGAGRGEAFGHLAEQTWRNRQVMQWPRCAPERLTEPLERAGLAIVARHVLQPF